MQLILFCRRMRGTRGLCPGHDAGPQMFHSRPVPSESWRAWVIVLLRIVCFKFVSAAKHAGQKRIEEVPQLMHQRSRNSRREPPDQQAENLRSGFGRVNQGEPAESMAVDILDPRWEMPPAAIPLWRVGILAPVAHSSASDSEAARQLPCGSNVFVAALVHAQGDVSTGGGYFPRS